MTDELPKQSYHENMGEIICYRFKDFRSMPLEKIVETLNEFHPMIQDDLETFRKLCEEGKEKARESISDRLTVIVRDYILLLAAYVSKVDPEYNKRNPNPDLVDDLSYAGILYDVALELVK